MSKVTVIQPTGNTAFPRKTRVCAYARVSSESEDQKNSFLAQVDFYTKYINGNPDWEYIDIYADEGLSALKMDKRNEFLRMLDDCRKGRIDKILTKSISRFSRNTKDCLETLRELKHLGVEIEFEKERINTGRTSDEMMIGILSAMAQEESISISQNMRMSYKRRMKNGTFNTCVAPYGYKMTENGELAVIYEQAQIVKRIFNEYLDGKSKCKIARDLTGEGIKMRNGKTSWNDKVIKYILHNQRYMGDALLQKQYTTDTLPYRQLTNKGEREQYYVENANAPIITKETFQKARTLIENKKTVYWYDAKPQGYPLSKMLYCTECGASFRRKTGYRQRIYWSCRTHDADTKSCKAPPVAEIDIYSAFERMCIKLKQNSKYILSPMIEQLQKMQSAYSTAYTKIGDISKEIAELTEQNLVINRLKAKGYMDSALFISQCNEINAKIMYLRAQKRQILSKDEYDMIIANTKIIEDILAENEIIDFNEEIFQGIVKKAIISSDKRITFILINSLELTEKLAGGERL